MIQTDDYIALLKDELADTKRRLKKSSKEGRPVIEHQIQQIERDIRRNSMKNEHAGVPQKGVVS
jgi:flagellar biosynthesis protein FlhB